MPVSRWIEVPNPALPDSGNLGTRVAEARDDAVDYRLEFLRHYREFCGLVSAESRPGVAVVAIDRTEGRLAGVGFVGGRVGEPNAMIIGRHSAADLVLSRDPTLSLRQLAVVVEPLTDLRPGRGVTYRMIDLRSGRGLCTEEGRVLSGLRADGPGFFHVGRYVLFVFVTGDPTDWPDSPFDAWSFIPERIYLAEQLRHASGSGRRRAVPIDRAHTLIQETAQPGRLDGRHLLARGERIVAELALFRARRVKVGATALERGILIGRAARCDSGGALEDQRLSRVHLLIVAVREQIYAIDTASTNGSRLADEPGHLRVRALPDRAELELADVAQIGWRRSCFEDGPAAWG